MAANSLAVVRPTSSSPNTAQAEPPCCTGPLHYAQVHAGLLRRFLFSQASLRRSLAGLFAQVSCRTLRAGLDPTGHFCRTLAQVHHGSSSSQSLACLLAQDSYRLQVIGANRSRLGHHWIYNYTLDWNSITAWPLSCLFMATNSPDQPSPGRRWLLQSKETSYLSLLLQH